MESTVTKRVISLGLAGLVVGFVVLGLGGRILMRLLAFLTPEPPRFTLGGTVQVIGVGTLWGGITAPLLMVLTRWKPLFRRAFGLLLGLVVMAPALVLFLLFSGFRGSLVAPPILIIGAMVLFPLLFIAHGYVLEAITWLPALLRKDQLDA